MFFSFIIIYYYQKLQRGQDGRYVTVFASPGRWWDIADNSNVN